MKAEEAAKAEETAQSEGAESAGANIDEKKQTDTESEENKNEDEDVSTPDAATASEPLPRWVGRTNLSNVSLNIGGDG